MANGKEQVDMYILYGVNVDTGTMSTGFGTVLRKSRTLTIVLYSVIHEFVGYKLACCLPVAAARCEMRDAR